jgi:hypothetical protein
MRIVRAPMRWLPNNGSFFAPLRASNQRTTGRMFVAKPPATVSSPLCITVERAEGGRSRQSI